MRTLLLFSTIFAHRVSSEFEDVRGTIDLFDKMLKTPAVQKFTTLTNVGKEAAEFTAKLIPFGSLILDAAKQTLEEDKQEKLTELVVKLDEKIEEIRIRQDLIFRDELYRDLKAEFERNIREPIEYFSRRLEYFSAIGWDISITDLTSFRLQCTGYNGSEKIAKRLSKLAETCQNKPLNTALLHSLHNNFQQYEYLNLSMTQQNETEFQRLFTKFYFFLDSHPEMQMKLHQIRDLIKNSPYAENKFHASQLIASTIGFRADAKVASECLLSVLFINSKYNREALLNAGASLMQHLFATIYISESCASLGDFGGTDKARIFTNLIYRDLQVFQQFLSTWFGEQLHATWHIIEMRLIGDEAEKFLTPLGRLPIKAHYINIAESVEHTLIDVGHPEYRRSYIIVSARTKVNQLSQLWSPAMAYSCVHMNCAQVKTGNLFIVVFRTRFVDSTADHIQFNKFVRFVDRKRPIFIKALDEQLKLYDEPANVVKELANQYSFNLTRFGEHQGYALLRASKPNFINTCKTKYGVLTFNILGNKLMQAIGHHSSTVDSTGNSFVQHCADWTLFLV